MSFIRKYGVQTDIYFPLIKVGGNNFAVSGDYTHSSGDVKISKDGGAAATATNSPSAVTMGNGAMWKITLTATEMQAKTVVVTVIDATTKAVEDQMIVVETYGTANGEIDTNDFADATLLRDVSNTEATAGEHTLTTLVLAGLEWSISGTTWTIKRTNGSTTHATKTLSTATSSSVVTGVN